MNFENLVRITVQTKIINMKANKKIMIMTAIMLIVAGSFVSCEDKELSICECGRVYINETEFVAMCIVPREVTANSTHVVRMENRTGHTISWKAPIWVSFYGENGWETVFPRLGTNILWTNDVTSLRPGGTKEQPGNFYAATEAWNEGKKGLYRMGRNVILSSDGHDTIITLYAEFEIR